MPDFAKQYHAIRSKEGRMYSDEELLHLPLVPKTHQHFEEWQIRKASADRILKRFRNANKALKILDIGCGNGWFAHHLSQINAAKVLGIDVEGDEIRQAASVFANLKLRLEFRALDIFGNELDGMQFDRITLGASIQYFPDLSLLISRLRSLLSPEGEIHVFDSPFYPKEELKAASERSQAYYQKMGYPDLAQFYHHHSLEEAIELGGQILYDPATIGSKLGKRILGIRNSPFPWLRFP